MTQDTEGWKNGEKISISQEALNEFISIPIKNEQLESVRSLCAKTRELYPSPNRGKWCNEEGIKELKRRVSVLRSGEDLNVLF